MGNQQNRTAPLSGTGTNPGQTTSALHMMTRFQSGGRKITGTLKGQTDREWRWDSRG